MTNQPASLQGTRIAELSPYAGMIRHQGEAMPGPYVASPALEMTVQTFLMQHRLPEESSRSPRLLLIQGEPGTGKTEITSRTALACGSLMMLPPSVFASRHEGGGVLAVTEALEEAERHSRIHRRPVAVLFDDIDHSILSVGENTGHTVNSADMIGFLQSLSHDRQRFLTFDGLPIPFLATANAPDRMAASLFRHMRARIVTHEVEENTRLDLAHALFAPSGATERSFLTKLFQRYRNEPIAFWPALASDYRAARIARLIREHGFDPARVHAGIHERVPLDRNLLNALALRCRSDRPRGFL